jgi:hypothetical protein
LGQGRLNREPYDRAVVFLLVLVGLLTGLVVSFVIDAWRGRHRGRSVADEAQRWLDHRR